MGRSRFAEMDSRGNAAARLIHPQASRSRGSPLVTGLGFGFRLPEPPLRFPLVRDVLTARQTMHDVARCDSIKSEKAGEATLRQSTLKEGLHGEILSPLRHRILVTRLDCYAEG